LKVLCIITIIVAILLMLILWVKQNAYCAEWYKPSDVGSVTQFSQEMPYANESEMYDHEVTRIMMILGKFIDKDRRFKLELEGFVSFHVSNQELGGDYERNAKEIGANVVPKYYWHLEKTSLYIGIPLGFSHLLDAENQPNFGNSGLLGTFGVAIGADTPFYKDFLIRIEYRATHTSDPYNSDLGRNLHGLALGVIWKW